MEDEVVIRAEHVGKVFRLPHQRQTSIKSLFVNLFRGKRSYEKQQVLEDVSLEIRQGEFFGIVGRNGSGKSTLLKLLAGIYTPDQGSLQVRGSLTPFIELGVGFNPELTGRENVYLNGALLGFNRREMDGMYKDIVRFAELGKFMDQKLKNYSSGMQVRLAFSIATRAKSQILLIDEVLAVGDTAFQKKCFDYFTSLKGKRTVIFVTHDMEAVKRFCDRVMVIDKSKSLGIFTPKDAAIEYEKIMDAIVQKNVDKQPEDDKRSDMGQRDIEISASRPVLKRRLLRPGDDIGLEIEISCHKPELIGTPLVLGVGLCDERGVNIIGPNSKGRLELTAQTKQTVRFTLHKNPFLNGYISINLGLFKADLSETYHFVFVAHELHVVNDTDEGGIIQYQDVSWRLK